ncbi:regulatory protein RecX [Hwanghaeella sp.]|uniref:regulatory protein RecX n=1 Tax=Hwanghaeella sp. TaxID=2605943 RepID=UPI003CCC0E64
MAVDNRQNSSRPRRGPKKATPERLEKSALFYLERFASSSENLRRVLMRRVEASAKEHGTDREEGARFIDSLIERYQRAGLLDDAAYAEARVTSLHRRGLSDRAIAMKLRQKGVPAELIDRSLEALREEHRADGADANREAAMNYARRRRIGPFRQTARQENRDRDLAALGRQGFDYETARRIVDAETETEL